MPEAPIPDPALVLLVGASGAGKSTWAAQRFRAAEVVSSDHLRGIVGSGPSDLDASGDAFTVLDVVVRARARRGLTVVVDTLGLDEARRLAWRGLAKQSGLPAVAVVFDTDPDLCRRRNAARDRPVPAPVLAAQLRSVTEVAPRLEAEGWDVVVRVPSEGGGGTSGAVAGTTAGTVDPGDRRAPSGSATTTRLPLVLQLSTFPWGEDPAGWLVSMASAAQEAGFAGLALMDHLIQIPQVGRPWDPLPEPFTVLGLLAGAAPGLELGTLVTPVTYRPAGVLAKTLATLDVLTGGRAFCGIGAGWWEREHAAYGLAFPSARERLDALETTAETLRALWAPGTKAYDGERVSLPETTLYPRPVSPIPLIIGGGGERRTLRIAARWGDACNLTTTEPEVVARKSEVLRTHCGHVGRDPDEVAVTVLDLPVLGADRDAVASAVERLRGRTPAVVFARRHHAGLPQDHLRRYAALAEIGVRRVFVGAQGLRGPEDLEPWTRVTEALT
jgi:alkanesulfonate monooxygenase SsuD/methylene tetrahydromethanopterin reductase-like flavin-dependent oxidoreductase (luciferase family)/predicted kinase